jgi:peptidoglycan/LPS O-acetylase OafA/YrhL
VDELNPIVAPTEHTETTPGWMPGIEALRGLAAIAVVCHHLWSLSTMPRFTGAWLLEGFGSWGVDIFFLLSGFLLAEPFWRPGGRPSLPSWYVRRVFRIAPAYYANVALLFVFFAAHAHLFSAIGRRQVVANATFTFWMQPETSTSLGVNGVLWTLSIEMVLYALMPALAILIARRPRIAFAAFMSIGLGWRLIVARQPDLVRGIFFEPGETLDEGIQRLYMSRQFPGILSIFALGIGVRWLVHRGFIKMPSVPLRRFPVATLGVLLIPSLAFLRFVQRGSQYDHWIWFTLFDLTLVMLAVPAILHAARPSRGAIGPVLRAWTWVGERSYGIYLWHFPVILSVYGRGPAMAAPDVTHIVPKVVLVLGLSLALGWASYEMVERPGRQVGQRLISAGLRGRRALRRSQPRVGSIDDHACPQGVDTPS